MAEKQSGKGKSPGPTGMQEEINLQIRREIRTGHYHPGDRLPSRAELETQYGTTPVTVQKAFDKLGRDGFIRSEGSKGTFVADHPPCFSNYGVIFPDSIHTGDLSEMTFFTVLYQQVERRNAEADVRFTVYTGLNGHEDEPDYTRLREDISSENLAGLIFASSPHLLAETQLFRELQQRQDLPKVAFMSKPSFPGIPVIGSRNDDYLSLIFRCLEKHHVRRLAIITALSGYLGRRQIPDEDAVFAEAKKYDIQILPHHVQVMHPSLAPKARQLTQLLLHCRENEVPGALLIMDDSLVESVSRGIKDSDLAPPDDLVVIGRCNFPAIPPSAVPITLYGLNVSVFVDTCIELLDKQRRGETPPAVTQLPCEFKEIK